MAGNAIVETRRDFMDSDSASIKLGNFLNPIFSKSVSQCPNLPPHAFTFKENNNAPILFGVNFKGWQTSYPPWNEWVQRMEPHHGKLWRNVGIYDAIKSNTQHIIPHKDVVMALAQKWNPDTSSFVFKWGEASMTIEDVCFIGGFSPLGDSVSQSLDTQDLVQVDKRLKEARRRIYYSGPKKVLLSHWINLYREIPNDFGDIEHVAFLVFWLSKYVFPEKVNDVVGKHVHAIAIRLARGVRIALAPAVLASIYRDLRVLRAAISGGGTLDIDISAPMQLLQIWVWERFPLLRPQANLIAPDQHIMDRSNRLSRLSLGASDIRFAMEMSASRFSWRPYIWFFDNHELTKNMYMDAEPRYLEYDELDPKLKTVAKFLRPSLLRGLDCTEYYLPQRVARQFGFDQDLSTPLRHYIENYDVERIDYNRPVENQMLYIPPKQIKNKVTCRYIIWWNRSKSFV